MRLRKRRAPRERNLAAAQARIHRQAEKNAVHEVVWHWQSKRRRVARANAWLVAVKHQTAATTGHFGLTKERQRGRESEG